MGMAVPGHAVDAGVHGDAICRHQPTGESQNQGGFAITGQVVGQGHFEFPCDLGIAALRVNFNVVPQGGAVGKFDGCTFRKDQGQGRRETFP